ncbi:MAG: hypothetical protein R6U32_07505 [Candidatus Woesearchaeota archaeon]
MEDQFPLFKSPLEYLTIFNDDEKTLSELPIFVEHIHYTGNVFISREDFERSIASIPEDVAEELKNNVIFTNEKVFLRGHNYYLPGARDAHKSKLQKLFSNMFILNDLIPEVKNRVEDDLTSRLIVSSVFDHLKNYSMILFNGFYRDYLKKGKVNGDIATLMGMCSKFVDYYYSLITSVSRRFTKFDESTIRDLMGKASEQDYSKLSHFYREMDHPARILLQSANITNLARTKYDVVVNPLSGAVELGFALDTISKNANIPRVCDILPVEYSGYKAVANKINNFDDFVREAILPIYHDTAICTEFMPFLILDDNIGSGQTMKNLLDLFCEKYQHIHTSVIEAKTRNMPGDRSDYVPEKHIQMLTYKPVGELRRGNFVKESIYKLLEGKI